jgi:hypothetical protein
MKKKFKIYYPSDFHDKSLAGKRYKPPEKHMIVMNSDGLFWLVDFSDYYLYIKKLSDVLEKWDVVWND